MQNLYRILEKIKELLKTIYNSIGNNNLKENILNALPFWVGAFMTGLISVFYSKLFFWAEQLSKFIFVQNRWVFLLITPVCFLLASWLVRRFAPFSKGSGIPQVSASIELSVPKFNHTVNKLLSLRVIFIKVCSSIIMIFGGGVVGREGPTIQISGSVFKIINDSLPGWFPKISKRNMIVTGAAAGLASAFNTPLGGIVFAIEELTKTHFNFFKSALLTGVIIAGLTALNLSGPYLYLGFPDINDISYWIIMIIIPVSIITGLAGSGTGNGLIFILKKSQSYIGKFRKPGYIVFCGLLVASLAILTDENALGSGKDFMLTSLFSHNKYTEWDLPFLRIFNMIISYSVGASGGIFAPSLSAGASIGSVISGWLHLSEANTNLIILCGMVGFLTGITRSPFTSSILVIEMTNNHNIIFHLMLTALVANLVSNFINKHSIYDQLKENYIEELSRGGESQSTKSGVRKV